MPFYHASEVIGAAWKNRRNLNNEFQSHNGLVWEPISYLSSGTYGDVQGIFL